MPISLGVVRVAMVGVAIAFLCRPRKTAWFCAMVGLQVASVTIELPVMSNCWLFTGIVNFGILAAAWRASRAKSDPFQTLEIEDIYQQAAPMLRVSLILLYAFTALAKYNSDFFRVDVSAAAYFAKVMLESNVALSFMSEWTSVGLSAIGVTVFAETAIPLMLLMPRMRRYAVLMGMVFHTVLAHNPHVSVFDFSAMMFALYVTFVPEDFFEKVTTNSKTRWVCVLAEYRGWILSALMLAS